MKKWMKILLTLGIVWSLSSTATAIIWDYKYDADVMPGVANCITDNAGNGIASWQGSAAVTTPSAKVYLGTGSAAGTLFIDDKNTGGGHNYLKWTDFEGGAITLYARMAMLESNTSNLAPIMIDDGFSRKELWIYSNHVTGAETLFIDMTVMRGIWFSIEADGAATVWIENAEEPTGWTQLAPYDSGASYGSYIYLLDIFSSADAKQQWDFVYWKEGTAIAVPEPITIGLLTLGVFALRRRKS